MQKYREVNILLTPRYQKFFLFMKELAQGKGHKLRRRLLRDALNVPAKMKTREKKKQDLLSGIQGEVNNFLLKIVTANLSNEKVDFKEIVLERKYRYLLSKIFSGDDIYESHELEFLVVESFRKLDMRASANKEDKGSGTFQDIVDLMRSIIDDLSEEEKI